MRAIHPPAILALLLLLPSVAVPAELPSIDSPLKTGQSAKGDWAVVIGVEDYAFLPAPPYARRDAEAMYQFLQYTRGVPAQRMALLVSGTSRTKIERAVAEAGASVGPGGTVTSDCWRDSYAGLSTTNPTGASAGPYRVLRGGSWFSSPAYARVAYRDWSGSGDRYDDLGFRLARAGP